MSKDTSDTSPRTETFVKEKVMVGEKDSMYYNDLESKDGGQRGVLMYLPHQKSHSIPERQLPVNTSSVDPGPRTLNLPMLTTSRTRTVRTR